MGAVGPRIGTDGAGRGSDDEIAEQTVVDASMNIQALAHIHILARSDALEIDEQVV